MRTAALVASLLVSAALAAACSSASGTPADGADPGGAGGVSGGGGAAGDGGEPAAPPLTVTPAETVLDPDQGESQVTFQVFLKDDSGADVEVTDETSFLASPLNMFQGPRMVLNPNSKGEITVTAKARGRTGKARVIVAKKVFSPGVDPAAADKFRAATDPDAPAPQIVYPPSGILVPPNMNSLEFHYLPAGNQDLFQLELLAPKGTLVTYFNCTPLQDGCVYTPEKAFWSSLANQARGLGPVRYRIRAVHADDPSTVAASQEGTIEFAGEDIIGGIYYWNAGAGIIQRYDFGYPGKQAENYMTAAGAGAGVCVGCHVLSRDGTRMVAGVDIPAPSIYKVFDVATKALKYSQGTGFPGDTKGGNFFSFSPDNKQLMTSDGNKIVLRDGENGNALADPLVPQGTMPDWAPDGKQMVYSRPGTLAPFATPSISSASIELLNFNGTIWGGNQTLVPFTGENNYYPSFSPDQGWVVFNRSPSNRNSMDNSSASGDGQIWAVSPKGGAPLRLTNASPSGDGDQWPKWSPNIMTYSGGNVMWVTFTSVRGYGLRLNKGAQAQLWMAAFDPARAAAGEDPSFPAFWLPFQDMGSGNHIAQWVSKIVRRGCKDKGECEGAESCENGYCVPDIK